jgi:hypothetical protein
MNLARAIGPAALLTIATPAFAEVSGYSTFEPAVAGLDVAIIEILGNQILLRADGRLLALWQGTMSGIGGSCTHTSRSRSAARLSDTATACCSYAPGAGRPSGQGSR